MSKTTSELPVIELATAEDFERWMEEHHGDTNGLWVKVRKAGAEVDWIDFEDALGVALCFGFINGIRREVDRDFFLQKFIPRAPDSRWLWTECDKAEWLIEQGRMRPEGLAEVEAAKADGRWDHAYEARGEVPVPTDFRARLASYPDAREFFETLDERNRNAVLVRLGPPTEHRIRQERLNKIIEMLRNHEKPY